jgi:glycosyltransferase involved in cell wall biosynthesis
MSGAEKKPVQVSILVPVRQEAANLSRCLDSVKWADEIFVVDSHSTDETPRIAEAHGATVVQFDFNGTWPKKKNWALENLPFRNEWVFILDADEVLPPGAEEEFARAIAAAGPIAGYWINRRFMFMGKWLRHSYYPNWNLRLFRHSLGRYEKLTGADTRSGDNEVHEHVIVRGPTGRLGCEMDHYAFPSVEVFVEKHNRYSNWEARVSADRQLSGSAAQIGSGPVERRRKLKQLSQRLPFRPLLRFLYIYIWQKGFLDGREGYYFARLHAFYEFLSKAKTYELTRTKAAPND